MAEARSYDTCIIGAGAAGLSLAFALGEAGHSVLLIERGGFDSGAINPSDDLHDVRSTDCHDPRHKTNRDAVGGTLHGWGGRCVPFDPEDFAPRKSLGGPGWPIPYEEYARWIAPAAQFLQTDANFNEPAPEGWIDVPGLRVDRVERLNSASHVRALQTRARCDRTTFDLLDRTCLLRTHWNGPQGSRQITTLELENDSSRFLIACRRVVLACGGLETTRQLLLAQSVQSDLFGGRDGPLGRTYMGHLTGSVATIRFKKPAAARAFAYARTPGLPSPFRRRMMLTGPTAVHAAFWLENLSPPDPGHRSGEISFKHLLAQRGRTPQAARHLGNMLRDPMGVADALGSVAAGMRRGADRRPPRLITRHGGPYMLAYHAEHLPVQDSRVTLAHATDRQGRRKLAIDFRYGDATIDGLAESHHALATRLSAAGLAQIEVPPDDALREAIIRQARDGYHQAGLARMSAAPADGVVDRNCRAHGTVNLYLASAAVFPVSGQANPTLSVVALALRLANFLNSGDDRAR